MMRKLTSIATLGFLLLLAACGQVSSPERGPTLEAQAGPGGDVVNWGDGSSSVPALPTGLRYTEIAAGFEHSLALRSDGQVVGWGGNTYGQLNVPALPTGVLYTEVAANRFYSLALRSDGQVVAWGQNDYGELGVPTLPTGTTYTAVAAGGYHGLAARSDGQVVAWGRNNRGQTDVVPPVAGETYVAVAAGDEFSLVLTNGGAIVAWGNNDSGQLVSPSRPAGTAFTAIAAGGSHALALRSDGQVFARGSSSSGKLDVPPLPAGTTYTAIAASEFVSHALRSDGQLLAWGNNISGQLDVPPLAPGTYYSDVATSSAALHTLAIVSPLAPTTEPYLIDFETALANRVLYNVKVGQGVVYEGSGSAITDTVRVDGYQYKNGKRFGGNQAKVISVGGDKVLAVVKQGTNTPNPTGAEVDIKPGKGFGGFSAGKNGLVTLTSITVSGVNSNGAKIILYGNGVFIKSIPLAKTATQTLTLNEPGVGFIQVRANDSFTVDDVRFEVGTPTQ